MILSALVEPAQELSRAEINRYSRHLVIPNVGMVGQRRLKNARVLVIGAGGLGSPNLLYLAAAGVGTLGIIDCDRVDDSNLQRQVIHGVDTVGEFKVDSARKAIARLNPFVHIETYKVRLERDMAIELFSRFDLIMDCTDNFATRYLVNDACVLANKPYVWGSIFRFEGQASVFWENAPNGPGPNYRDLYPAPPPPGMAPSCSEGGVFGVLCASIASVMATEAVKLITGIGETLLGRLVVYDALEMRYRELPVRRLPDRPPITELAESYDALCGLGLRTSSTSVPVPGISAIECKRLMDQNEMPILIDVREPTEWDIVHIPGAILVTKSPTVSQIIRQRYGEDACLVIVCKSGQRSAGVTAELLALGMRNVRNLEGGVLAWVKDVDPSLPGY